MSAYLARLKQLESVKNSHYAPDTEPSKPSKVPFDPFEGSVSAHIEKKIIDDGGTASEETAIRAWLAHINETDQEIIDDVLHQCRITDHDRAYFLRRAEEVPPPGVREHWVSCGDCRHFERTGHPHLGHCAQSKPEAIAGLWNTDRRWCESHA